ncbi:MAG: glycosyltransferase [Chloroflexi bacterium]|nr:glycosyltransferase [Chloroflexota bacterium]
MPSTVNRPYRILMVTGAYPAPETPHLGTFIKTQVDSLIASGLEVEVVHPKPGRPVPLRYASAAIQVFLKTLTGHFDIVHGHYGLWCLVARLQWTTPVVASFLGSDVLRDASLEGHSSKKDALVTHISRWLCRRVDAVNVKSEEMKKALKGEHITVYPDGINFELFHPIPRTEARAALGWDADRYYILFGNNPHRSEKNFPLAEAAVERLHSRGITAELVVANGLPQTQVVQYINASNAVILPSVYEGSPNIVKEAMACNVPVVATNVGDVCEVIGRTRGCKVCPADPDALARALEEALLHTEPTTGRNDIAHLECSVIARQVIAVYEQVTSRKSRKEAFAGISGS